MMPKTFLKVTAVANKIFSFINIDFMAWSKYIPVWNEFLPDKNPSVQVWNDSIPDWNRIIPDQTIISWQIHYISTIKGDRKKLTSGLSSIFNTWILRTIFIPKFWYVSGMNPFQSGRYSFQSGIKTFQLEWIPSTIENHILMYKLLIAV